MFLGRERREEGEEGEEEDEDEEAKTKKTTMKPWEQHSGREKSATKEAMCLLEKCFGTSAARESNNLELADAKLTAERRKVCPEELDQDGADGAECGHSADEYWNENEGKLSEDVSSQTKEDMRANQSRALSLVD
ncbi:uncharacterized protein LOC120296417 [Eucalyptus grandis]|uniref:uncharacterized protein LOC120296417 n=1 Tax=Eucalyptus grandis TaxID=71139 RepID=UPI00192EB82C|nr:uncharacterized protein LOC120296417 [Eucalyptus grandis]